LTVQKVEPGQGLVEYALIIILIALVVIVILSVFGDQLGATYSNIISSI
jgi:pilus assembly protein Flp/PilA